MNDRVKSCLSDIAFHAGNVMAFTAERTFGEYLEDIYFRSAVERQLELMADMVGELLKVAPDCAGRITHARRIAAFRNRLVHGYDTVDDSIAFRIATRAVPALLVDMGTLQEEGQW